MRYETLPNLQLPKIGFGTWRIGGQHGADPSSDEASLQALRSALELGYTHFDTAEVYADGHAEQLLGKAMREMGVAREMLTAYTPIHHRHTQSNPTLKAVAQARGATPQQIALAWLTTQPRVLTIPMSFNPRHQADNLRAAEMVLSEEEMEWLARG